MRSSRVPRHQLVWAILIIGLSGVGPGTLAAPAAEVVQLVDTPFMELVRDRVVHRELGLASVQVNAIRDVTDQFDPELFSTRNKRSPQRRRMLHNLVQKVRPRIRKLLTANQAVRLSQIELQWQGPRALLRPDVQAKLLLSKTQLESLAQAATDTDNGIVDAWKQAQKGGTKAALNKKIRKLKTDESRKILARLNGGQRTRWKSLLGRPAPLAQLGKGLRYKVPEFVSDMKWLNSPPLKMSSLRGKVVILHFYAFG